MSSNEDISGLNWPADHLLPQFEPPQHLTVYDARHASPGVQLSIATLTGLINRPQPRVYLILTNEDVFWLQELAASVPHETASAAGDDALPAILAAFPGSAKGLIIYDPAFQDSINIATTMAGQQDGIVVSPDRATSLQTVHGLPILADLRTFHWQDRVTAYEWARQNLLAGASARVIGGLDPTIAGGVRPFLVAIRAFVYWLDSRSFLPGFSDDPASQRGLMKRIFAPLAGQAVHLGWFIDEASGVSLTSAAAIPVLATDFMSNMETWTSILPAAPPKRPAALPPATINAASNKTYLSFIVSDGDNLQYIQRRMLALWRDPARGSVPLGWTFSPTLQEAAPAIYNYYLDSATPNDELVSGPSGAAYMFPSQWPAELLPAFWQRTGQAMKSLGMTHIEILDVDFLQSVNIPVIGELLQLGMIIRDDSMREQVARALAPFGITGVFSGAGLPRPSWDIFDGIPVYQNLGIISSVGQAVTLIRLASATFLHRPLFINAYVLAWSMTPSDIKQVVNQLGSDYEAVTPGTLLSLLAKAGA